ncbi:MAG: myo-inosose-2 dehydratase [Pseudomonadota bacterium]
MSLKIGISPIAWQNDDLPDLTAAYTMEQALEEARQIGYTGVERGQRMPADTEGLRAYLEKYDIALCGGWCSGASLVNDVAAEKQAVSEQVQQFIDLNAPCIVYAECSNTVQGDQKTPVANRPTLSRDEMKDYGKRVTELAKWMTDLGMPLSYHHHMGTIIESEDDVNWFMDATGVEVNLTFDTGHLLFGGGDVMATMNRWGDRIQHVHFKDIRPKVVDDIRTHNRTFLDAVVAGAFTVPGDGCIDFQAVADFLKSMDYAGWIVVEAEQDPAKAPPYEYSEKGYKHILDVCAHAGLEITT